jgi:putative ABC transport system permease protein
MNSFLQDVKYGLRMLCRAPGFTFAAIVALGLGIASSTAIFSVIDGVLLHPLPYPKSEEIVSLSQTIRSSSASTRDAAPANYIDWVAQNDVFSNMAAASGEQVNVSEGDRPERLRATVATAGMFPLFGVNPFLGRTLATSDEQPGRSNVAVLSFELWQRRYASDRGIIGREIRLNGQSHTVVGVMPAGYSPDGYGELWLPSPWGIPGNSLRPTEDPRQLRGSCYLTVWGRLKPGVSLEQARTQMNVIGLRLQSQYPTDNKDTGIAVVPLHEELVGNIRPVLFVLFAAVGFLLLIACANVANLMLARAASRSREVSIRAALGASRSRLIRQLLTESVMLALFGGLLGVLLAAWAIPVLLALSPPGIASFKGISLNLHVLAFTLSVSFATGLIFGLVPALSSSAASPIEGLRQGERGSTGAHSRGRSILIVAEVGLSLMLLIGAGLMIRSFSNLLRVDPGFRPDHLLVFNIGAPPAGDEDVQNRFYHEVLQRVGAVGGVERVGAVSRLPLSGGNSNRTFNVRGSDTEYTADVRVSTPDYFATMGIPLLRGRGFTDRDVKGSVSVALINDATARAVFPGTDPIGKYITNIGPKDETLQIIGVIGNVRHLALATAPRPEIYQPLGQATWPSVYFAVRTAAANSLTVLPAVQKAVWSLNRDVPLGNAQTMEDLVARSLSQRKFTMLLLTIFAGAALLLAGIGLYGVIAYMLSQRTRELGIRTALGARRIDLLKLVLGQGLALVAVGVLLGVIASLGVTRTMKTLLYGVTATDPVTFAILSASIFVVGLVACWFPARRASNVNPMVALRSE